MNSTLKKVFYWLYSKAKEIRPNSWELCREYVKADHSVILGQGSNVDIKYRPLLPSVRVEIGANSQIFGSLIILRPDAYIRIGQRTQIGFSTLIAACGIEIGNDVLMAWDITVMDNDSHSVIWDERKYDVAQCEKDYRETPNDFSRHKDWSSVKMAPIRIQDKAWIGFRVSILKGVTVGEGAVIGACSVVTRDVPPFSLVAGNPARIIRKLPDYTHE
jgi:acetyltransferase-like isoleucine patch superfamily enzyme